MLKTGRYQHYKGQDYQVLGVATHSETQERLVVYRPLYGRGDLWVRPLAMFTDTLSVDGQTRERFRYLGPSPDDGEEMP